MLPETVGSPLYGWIIKNYIKKYVQQKNLDEFIVHGVGLWAFAGALLKRDYGRKVKTISSYFTTAMHEIYWLMQGVSIKDHGVSLKAKYVFAYITSYLILKPVESYLLKRMDRIIVHYDSTKRIITNGFNVNESRIVKTSYFTETYAKKTGEARKIDRRLLDKEPLCAVICRQTPRKGVNLIIRALERIPSEKRPHTLIVGTGDLLEKHKKLVDKLGLGEHVTFTGYVEDINPILENIDVFIQASLQEGSGSISVLEAMKRGIPIVSTSCDGVPEDIEDMKTGLLVEPGNIGGISTAIMRILDNKALAKKLGRNAKKEYEKKFNYENMVNSISKVYNS